MQKEVNSIIHLIALLKKETDCPICLHTLVNPVTTTCYHTFCRTCINPVLEDNSLCPLCKKKITRRGTTTNARAKNLVHGVSVFVNAFKNETGFDLQSHYEDTAATLESRNYEEEVVGNNIQGMGIRTESVCLDEGRPSGVASQKAHRLYQGGDIDRMVVEESGELGSALLSESCNEIDHMSVSQSAPVDQPSRKKSSSGLSMSLRKCRLSLPGTPTSREKKVKEWLNMGDVASVSATVSCDKAKSPLKFTDPDDKFSGDSASLNWDKNDFNKLPCGNKCGKRVYGGVNISEDLLPPSAKARKSKKYVIFDEEDEVEVVYSPKKEDAIPDSCPVEVNDTFDKLVSELREKNSNKRDPTPEKTVLEQEKNDITLFESLPLAVDNGLCVKKKYTRSSNMDEGISRKCEFKYADRRVKRKISSEEGLINRTSKKGKTLMTEDVNSEKKDNCELHDTSYGDSNEENNLQVAKGEVKRQDTNLLTEKSLSSKLALVPDIVEQVKGSKRMPKRGRRRCSEINTVSASPGWSCLKSAHKDFRSRKKTAALSALNVSGGVPCNVSASRQNSSRKKLGLCIDDPPMSYVSIDDNGSSVAVVDVLKKKPATMKTTVKDDKADIDNQEDPIATACLMVPNVEPFVHVPLPVPSTPVPFISLGDSMHNQTTSAPPSEHPVLDISLQKTVERRTPFTVGKSGASNQNPSAARVPLEVVKLDISKDLASTSVKSPSKNTKVDILKQITAMPTALSKVGDSYVTEHVQSPLTSCSKIEEPKPTSQSTAKAAPMIVILESHTVGISKPEKCTDILKNALTPKVNEGPQVATSSVKGGKEGEIVEVIHNEGNEAESSSSCYKIKTMSNISDIIYNSSLRSLSKKHDRKTKSVVVKRKTFSLDTNTEDLSELADLRESTEDQLEGFRASTKTNSPEDKCQRNNTFIHDKYNTAHVGKHKSIPRENMDLERQSSKYFPTVLVEKSARKKSLLRKPKLFVPVFKMGLLNRKGAHSGRRVSFYVLGNLRKSGRAIKTSEVGVDTGPINHQNRLSNIKEAVLKTTVDVGVQTILSGKFELGLPLGKSPGAIESNPFCKSPLDVQPPSATYEYVSPLGKILGEGFDTNERSRFECKDLRSTLLAIAREPGQEKPFSVEDCSSDLIPDSELSGFKDQGVRALRHTRSHHKRLTRKSNSKKAVCQLFSNTKSGLSREEMALPLTCTQKSTAEEENCFKTAVFPGSEERDVVYLDCESGHKGGEIEKNLEKMKVLQSQNKLKDSNDKSKWSPIPEESSSKMMRNSSSLEHCEEELDSEELEGKRKMIIANIEADMNIRKRNSSERVNSDTSSVKICSNEYVEVASNNCDSYSSSFVPETNPLALTYIGDSESDHELEKDTDLDKDKEDKVEGDELKHPLLPSLKDCSGDESDFFVEGSQKDVKTLEKSVIVKKPPMSLVISGLRMNEVIQVRKLVVMFNLHFSPIFCTEGNQIKIPPTTHVVTRTDNSGKTACTFKYLCGVVTGCWIVSIRWVSDSLKAGILLDEDPFEVLDDSGHCGPFLGRNSTTKLLKDLEFYCLKPFLEMTFKQMKEVIELGGGKVVSEIEEFSGRKGMQLAIIETTTKDSEETFARLAQSNIAVVTSDWILESVGHYKLQSLIGHVVNLDSNVKTFSEYRESLVAMGYSEDLLGIEDEQTEFFMREAEEEQMNSSKEDVDDDE